MEIFSIPLASLLTSSTEKGKEISDNELWMDEFIFIELKQRNDLVFFLLCIGGEGEKERE